MIVKKPWRWVKLNIFNNKNKEDQYDRIRDYMGYWLFGIIPIFLIKLDDYIKSDNGDIKIREDIIKYCK